MSIDLDALRSLGFTLERIDGDQLALRDLLDPKFHPLSVDFLSGKLIHRLKYGLSKNDALPRALGLKSINPEHAPVVVDATSGLGTDTLVMAALGCRVHAIERNPVVFALLEDGYRRLIEEAHRKANDDDDRTLLTLANRMSIQPGDSALVMREFFVGNSSDFPQKPDIVYLDPMFPEEGRSKSALPKKGMQMFRRLIGESDTDAAQVFAAAVQLARKRVVVKRPSAAPPLSPRPDHVYEGKTARYDVYRS